MRCECVRLSFSLRGCRELRQCRGSHGGAVRCPSCKSPMVALRFVEGAELDTLLHARARLEQLLGGGPMRGRMLCELCVDGGSRRCVGSGNAVAWDWLGSSDWLADLDNMQAAAVQPQPQPPPVLQQQQPAQEQPPQQPALAYGHRPANGAYHLALQQQQQQYTAQKLGWPVMLPAGLAVPATLPGSGPLVPSQLQWHQWQAQQAAGQWAAQQAAQLQDGQGNAPAGSSFPAAGGLGRARREPKPSAKALAARQSAEPEPEDEAPHLAPVSQPWQQQAALTAAAAPAAALQTPAEELPEDMRHAVRSQAPENACSGCTRDAHINEEQEGCGARSLPRCQLPPVVSPPPHACRPPPLIPSTPLPHTHTITTTATPCAVWPGPPPSLQRQWWWKSKEYRLSEGEVRRASSRGTQASVEQPRPDGSSACGAGNARRLVKSASYRGFCCHSVRSNRWATHCALSGPPSVSMQDFIWTPHVEQLQPGHPDFRRSVK